MACKPVPYLASVLQGGGGGGGGISRPMMCSIYALLYNKQCKTRVLIGLEECVIIDAPLMSLSGVTSAHDGRT